MSLLQSVTVRHQPSTCSDMPTGTEGVLVRLMKGSQEYTEWRTKFYNCIKIVTS
jgi:hypothetical protein